MGAIVSTISSISSIAKAIDTIVSISISRPLGSVDSANRVSSIDPRSSIAIGGVVSNSDRLSITTDGNTTSNSRGGMGAIVSTISSIASIAKAIGTIVGISISRPLGSVDSTNRVSSIDSRSSIAIGGVVSNSGRLSITTDGNTTSNSRGSMGSIVSSISGISMTISSIAEAISTIVSISISRPLAIVSKSIAISGGISLQRESSMRDGGETRSLGSKVDSISTIV